MAVKCPYCRSNNSHDATFCAKCGLPLSTPDAAGAKSPGPEKPELSETKTILNPEKGFSTKSPFAGRYEILEILGKGGMGIVYKAQDTKLKRSVALKFLPAELTIDPEAQERFMQEAQAAAGLSHPNICTVHEVDEAEGKSFISMEFIDGQSLKEKMSEGPLKAEEALGIVLQIAEGLSEAHQKGIIHRDIKSANIMVSEKGQVKIMDFGLAKLTGGVDLTQTTRIMGTVSYMSPEQARGEVVDKRTDIWSLGVLLYEMLAGRLPFRGDNFQAVFYSILNEEPEPLGKLHSDLEGGFENIIFKALQKNPAQRYQYLSEFLEDLRAIKQRKDIEVQPRLRKKRQLRPIFILASVVALFIVAFFAIRSYFQPQPSSPVQRRSVAVMYFENLSEDPSINWMQKGVVELLNAGLSRSQEVQVLDSQRLFDILRDMGKQEARTIDQKSASEVAKRADVKTMVLGNIIKVGSRIRIQSRIVDAASGEILHAAQADGDSDEDIFSIVASLTDEIQKYFQVRTEGERIDEIWLKDIMTNSVEAYRLFIEGREYLFRSDWEKAGKLYEKAVKIDPDFAVCYVDLAAVNWNLEDYPAMNDAYRNALRLRDKVSSKERLWIDIFGATTSGENEKAIPLLLEFLKYDPGNKLSRYLLGRSYFFSGQTEKAVGVWKDLADGRWNWIWVYYYLGDAYIQMDRFSDAVEVYRIGLEVSPGSSFMYAKLSIAFHHRGETASSDLYHERFLEETKKHMENAVEICLQAGSEYLNNQMYEKAIASFIIGLSAFPQDGRLHMGLGRSYFGAGDYQKARDEFLKVLEIDADQKRAYFRLGRAYEELGQKEEAIRSYAKYIGLQKQGEWVEDARLRLNRIQGIE